MDTGQVADLMREAVNIVIKLASPMLLLSMLVGVGGGHFPGGHSDP